MDSHEEDLKQPEQTTNELENLKAPPHPTWGGRWRGVLYDEADRLGANQRDEECLRRSSWAGRQRRRRPKHDAGKRTETSTRSYSRFPRDKDIIFHTQRDSSTLHICNWLVGQAQAARLQTCSDGFWFLGTLGRVYIATQLHSRFLPSGLYKGSTIFENSTENFILLIKTDHFIVLINLAYWCQINFVHVHHCYPSCIHKAVAVSKKFINQNFRICNHPSESG